MAQIAHLVRIHAKPESVFARVGSTAGIVDWFTEASSPEYCKGGSLDLHFGDERISFAVPEWTEPTRIVWQCTTRENIWFNTEIVFEFEAQGEDTIVRFDHLGWPDMSDRFRDCSMSWAYFLESLKSLIEEGRGTPESEAPACDSSPDT